MADLSEPQRAMLIILDGSAWWSADLLLPVLSKQHSTTQGLHQTAASLVRRGYADKRWQHPRGGRRRVVYRITPRGREMLAAARSLDHQKGWP